MKWITKIQLLKITFLMLYGDWKAFVTLKPGYEPNNELELKIMNFIRKKLSPLAMPQEIEYMDTLPKTRSGKIMRRILHAREWGEEIGDTSTLEEDE